MVANLAAGTPVQGQGVTLGSIVVFAAGADGDAEPLRVIRGPATGLRLPDGLIVDRRGRIYVTNYPGAINDDTVRIFAPDADGDAAPERVIGGPHTGLDWPVGLALDREERLYVGNGGRVTRDPGPGITVYEAGAADDATPIRTIVGGLQSGEEMWPHRLTFGRRDSLFVRTMAVLAVYAPGVTEASVPARLIYENVPRGPGRPFKTVRSPQRFVLDPYDSMYVITGDTVMVYAPGYSAHEPEVRRIAGPHTGIHSPQDIALDDRGWLYLVDYDSSLVRVFAPGATGDVAPSRTIGGPTTRLFLPGTIALDRKRRVYVANLEFRGPLIKLRR